MEDKLEISKELLPENERIGIYKLHGKERIHIPEKIKNHEQLIDLLVKYHKALEKLESLNNQNK